MLQILDPKDWQEEIDELIPAIREFSLLENNRIGWNYPLDYSFIAHHFREISEYIKPDMEMLDIGVGPGAIHGYLESTHNVNIYGIDMGGNPNWGKGYIDQRIDFLNPSINKQYDVIISVSAVEHQSKINHGKCIDKCKELLKPGGYCFITASLNNNGAATAGQLNLTVKELEEMYDDTFINPDYDEALQGYYDSAIIYDAYKHRYRKNDIDFLAYGYTYQKPL